VPVLVAARSTVWVCGRSLPEILGLNSARAWSSVCCDCCVVSNRGVCDELITRPDESYRLWCVVVCDLETSRMKKPWPALGRSAKRTKKNACYYIFSHWNWFLRLEFSDRICKSMWPAVIKICHTVSDLPRISFRLAVSHVYEFFQGSLFSKCSHKLKSPT